jgi:hypothetical protein
VEVRFGGQTVSFVWRSRPYFIEARARAAPRTSSATDCGRY